MSNRLHLKVLPGGRGTSDSEYPNFIECEATNTRLMGVIGVRAVEGTHGATQNVHFFHLDFEEYGIDGYERLEASGSHDIEQMTARMMGGLGGQRVPITRDEMIWLIRQAYRLNRKSQSELPEGVEGLFGFIRSEMKIGSVDSDTLWQSLTVPIETDIELVNYYMMRVAAHDGEGTEFLCRNGFSPGVLEAPKGVMVRNRVQQIREIGGLRYLQSETLVDTDREYWMIASEIAVFEEDGARRVFGVSVQGQFRVTEYEASFILRRPEHLLVYDILEKDRLRLYLDFHKPGALVNHHDAGILYTWFKPNNHHVRDPLYFINSDVQVFYYLTEEDQLVVCALEEAWLKAAEEELATSDMNLWVRLEETYYSELPILYDFVQSDYLDFHEFWEDAQT